MCLYTKEEQMPNIRPDSGLREGFMRCFHSCSADNEESNVREEGLLNMLGLLNMSIIRQECQQRLPAELAGGSRRRRTNQVTATSVSRPGRLYLLYYYKYLLFIIYLLYRPGQVPLWETVVLRETRGLSCMATRASLRT